MPTRKFKFVSPGVFIDEIDNSQLPALPDQVGPVIIGRTERGPGLRPVKVSSFAEFVETFGNPIAGGQGGDVWREGNYTAPTYAAYAAQAWLRNSNSATIVRLLGAQHNDAPDGGAGEAGWMTKNSSGNQSSTNISNASNGGAFGLFVCDSGSAGSAPTGALAAIWYLNEGTIALSGTVRGNTSSGETAAAQTGSAVLIKSTGANKEFKIVIKDSSDNVKEHTTFNFTPSSDKYIRKVFNTNPTLTNTNITRANQRTTYWLGQSFERHLDTYVTGNTAGEQFGVILGLESGSYYGSNFRMNSRPCRSGWFLSQDLSNVTGSYSADQMTKLFRLHGINSGEWEQKNLKVSIVDIKASTNDFNQYGSFTVQVRKAKDNDNAPQIVEQYTAVNLNPNSTDYIANRIGDRYVTWDDSERRYREYGNYENKSRFLRVEMNGDVDAGATDPQLLPFGVYGPARPRGFAVISGSTSPLPWGVTSDSTLAIDGAANTLAVGAASIGASYPEQRGATYFVHVGNQSATQAAGPYFTASFLYPALPLRASSSEGWIANPKDTYWGAVSSQRGNTRHENSWADVVFPWGGGLNTFDAADINMEYSWVFSLDDLKPTGSSHAVYSSGSRAGTSGDGGSSFTAVSGTYKEVLTQGFDRFTSPLFGGFDGLDITEKEPFNNARALNGGTDVSNHAYNSVKRAIDSVADPEVVEYNLMVAPGITNESLTSHMINVCEDRGDALAIIDLKGGYVPGTENTSGEVTNRGSVKTAVDNLNNRQLNSSYGCAYYPWVQIRDSINNANLWVPPSIVALGTLSSAQKRSELWFAPAGFTRGGLTEGSAGLPVTGVRERLTSRDRDKLYEANINPIATFPAEGIVIFGQKTLQVTPSALDRINVRRLLIFVKKEISRMAARTLFDQNVQTTWDRFRNQVNPFLEGIKSRLGLTDYRLVLDESTTTAELVDRNVMYAKIYLKPARAIEFIALDFVITNSGAAFED